MKTSTIFAELVQLCDTLASLEMGPERAVAQRAFDTLVTMSKGLDEIASWQEGTAVNSSFDEPWSARKARETIEKANTP